MPDKSIMIGHEIWFFWILCMLWQKSENVDKDKFGWRNRKWTQQKMSDIGQKYEDRTRNMILQCF